MPLTGPDLDQRRVERVDLEERADLGLVGEDDVDVAVEQLEELGPVRSTQNAVGQREGGAPTRPPGPWRTPR